MRNFEHEIRQLLEHKSEQVLDASPPSNRFVWRVRLARAVLPTAVSIVAVAAVVGASTLASPTTRTVTPAPADRGETMRADADPRDRYPIPDAPMYLMPSERGLWVAGFRITHIDFASSTSASTEGLKGAAKGATVGLGMAWTAMEQEDGASRLIGARLQDDRVVVTDEVEIEGLDNIGNHFLATGHGAVWVTSADGRVHRYDPATQELDTFDISEHFKDYSHSNGALTVTAGDQYVWFAATPGSVVAFDPSTMEPVGLRQELDWNVAELDYTHGRVLVLQTSKRGAHRIWRIDETSGETIGDPIPLGKYGPEGTLVAKGTKAFVFRWTGGQKAFVYRANLVNGKVIKQQHVVKDPFGSFTVSWGYGWLGELAKREVRRIPLPHLLVD